MQEMEAIFIINKMIDSVNTIKLEYTMINRKSLARTSSEPGKTRQINFYNIDNNFYFVDLPRIWF